ncbi:serine acetyltransferase [Methylobacillus methanolivorans]
MNAVKLLKADTYRLYGQYSLKYLIKALVTRRTFRVIFTIRACQYIHQSKKLRFALPFFQAFHRFTAHSATMDISWRTKIGGGIALLHGWGIVINQEASIGNNVTIFHGVTIGQKDKIQKNGTRITEYPIIQDNVWIGPNAIIVGGITIGEGSRIAGGAFVTENIPARSIVLGNPAQIVKSDCLPDTLNAAPIL